MYLVSRSNWGNQWPKSLANSQVASAGVRPAQWTSIWVAAWWFRLTIHRSRIAWGWRGVSTCRKGSVERISRFPTFFLRRDTWNTGCMVAESGSCNFRPRYWFLLKPDRGHSIFRPVSEIGDEPESSVYKVGVWRTPYHLLQMISHPDVCWLTGPSCFEHPAGFSW